jgi:hypothetical protein
MATKLYRSAVHALWTVRYEEAFRRDDYDEMDRIREAWDKAYDAAAESVGEDVPDEVFDEARSKATLALLREGN